MFDEAYLKFSNEQLYELTGMSTDIERYAINDGFGLRTTVFLKGCPLRCRWCSNPETQKFNPEMVFFQDKCIGCLACVSKCKYGALENGLLAGRKICETCFKNENAFACIETCYPKCRKIVGENMTVREILDIVKRDRTFYQLSGGGVTISGGEPMAQPLYTYALLRAFSANWMDTAIETCGAGDQEDYAAIAPYLKLAFMDLKTTDREKHLEWVGGDNKSIKENIMHMDALAGKYGFDLIIRTPVIPGFNDKDEDIRKIAGFVSTNLKNYRGMEMLPYHKLGRGKYISLGREYELTDLKAPSEDRIMELNGILHDFGIPIYKF